MTLGTFLKKNGRSQKWLREQLRKKGVRRDPATISLWCNKKQFPKDAYVITAIADILGAEERIIKTLFNGTK